MRRLRPLHLAGTQEGRLNQPKRHVVVNLGRLFDQPPPASLESERALLGALLIDPKALHRVADLVPSAEAFSDAVNGVVYRAVSDIVAEFGTLDPVILADFLGADEALAGRDIPALLMDLASATPSAANARHYARVVRAKWDMRRLIVAAGEIAHSAYHAGLAEDSSAGVLRAAEDALFRVVADSHDKERPAPAASVADDVVASATNPEGDGLPIFSTGYWEIDKVLTGFRPGQMIVLAGRPGTGKTALGLSLIERMAGGVQGLGALFISREMPKRDLMHRMLASMSGVPMAAIRSGHLRSIDADRVRAAAERVRQMSLTIDDSTMLHTGQIAAGVRMVRHKHPVDIVVVDYLQRIRPPANVKFGGSEDRVAEVSAGLKDLALNEGVVVLALAQLNREMLKREDPRPRISDLRGSGQIEQDADVIGLMHRPWLHLDPRERAERSFEKKTTTIYFDKVRDGEPGSATLDFDGATMRFETLASAAGDNDPFLYHEAQR